MKIGAKTETLRYTFDKIQMDRQPVLFVLKDNDRFIGSMHCSTPTIEDIADCLNKSELELATIRAEKQTLEENLLIERKRKSELNLQYKELYAEKQKLETLLASHTIKLSDALGEKQEAVELLERARRCFSDHMKIYNDIKSFLVKHNI